MKTSPALFTEYEHLLHSKNSSKVTGLTAVKQMEPTMIVMMSTRVMPLTVTAKMTQMRSSSHSLLQMKNTPMSGQLQHAQDE